MPVTTPNVTPDLGSSSSTALIPVGTIVATNNGGLAMYVIALSAIAQYDAVAILQSSSALGASICAAPLSTTNGALSNRVGFAQTALAAAAYGWVHLSGSGLRVNCLIAAQPAVPLFTTATAGSLDDTIVSAGFVAGVTLLSSATSASAPPCVVGFSNIEQYG